MKTKMKMTGSVCLFGIAVLWCLGAWAASGRVVAPRQVRVTAAMSSDLLAAGQTQTAYLKVGLTGFEVEPVERRTQLNLALVLDKSGSMQGTKIEEAKRAAIQAIGRLHPDDIISVVTYDSTVNVLVPATRASDRETVYAAIRGISAGGNTALFAGVTKGAAEARKFFSKSRYNHLILLSDGLANVGPGSPAELRSLGRSLAAETLSVSTLGLGLGYNEDLMSDLAEASGGNHFFVESARDLAWVFDREFGGAMSVVAQDVHIEIELAPGIRPIRVLGREARIDGRRVQVDITQLYGEHEKYILLEIETPASAEGTRRSVGSVSVDYLNMATQQNDRIRRDVTVGFSASAEKVKEHVDSDVMVSVVEQVGTEQNQAAMKLRDEGRVEEAREALQSNALFYRRSAAQYDAPELAEQAEDERTDAESLEPGKWKERRKVMKEKQAGARQQMLKR